MTGKIYFFGPLVGVQGGKGRDHVAEKSIYPQGWQDRKRLSKILKDKSPTVSTPPTRSHFLMVPLPPNCTTLEQGHALTTGLWVRGTQSHAIFPRLGKVTKTLSWHP